MASQADINIGGVLYPGMVLVGLPADTVEATLAQLGSDLLQTVLFALAVSALGVWLLSRQALAPVKRVTAVARVISGRDLSQRVAVPQTRDEMSELADTLNNMLDRLQESFETQRRFTADASHELRTPVTAIVGHANYLLRRTKPSAEQVDSLTVIKREAERMAKLVNDLLELARADAGFAVERHPVNVVEVAEAVHMDLALSAGNVDIRVSSVQPVIEVLGDASRLKQVLLNLVQNAINAGAQQVAVSLAQERDAVRIEVLDNGPGIAAEAIPYLFDRFFRIGGARSGRGNGSGLGLAIVRWIVQQHQGEVLVESQLGEGTVFTVLLPAYSSKQSEARALTRPRTDRLPA
jgi:signal transduction histidine kinase